MKQLTWLGLAAMLTWGGVGFGAAQTTNQSSRLSYDSFRIISDRNIFNPNRYARGSSRPVTRTSSVPASRIEAITLVGTMAYEKGTYAFFDGTKSDYTKAAQVNESVGRYTVHGIAANRVTLADGTNTFEVKVGMQMRREDDGEWFLSDSTEREPRRVTSTRARTRGSYQSNSEDGTSETTTGEEPEVIVIDSDMLSGSETANGTAEAENGNGAADPVLLRLMQRREQMNQ